MEVVEELQKIPIKGQSCLNSKSDFCDAAKG